MMLYMMMYDVISWNVWCYMLCDVICYKIKHLHDRCLRLAYCDKNSSYEELLEKDGSVSIHHRNLAILQYEVKNELAPMITTNVFTPIPENHYIFRNYNGFRLLLCKNSLTWYWKYLVSRIRNTGYRSTRILKMPNPLTILKNL